MCLADHRPATDAHEEHQVDEERARASKQAAGPGNAADGRAPARESSERDTFAHESDARREDAALSVAGGESDVGLTGGSPSRSPARDVETYGRAERGRGPGDDAPLDTPPPLD
jgi:hypothetical protein